jgi:hypothetical protein
MRIKPDGTLDEVWPEPAALRPFETQKQEYDALLEQILRNNPTLTRAKASTKPRRCSTLRLGAAAADFVSYDIQSRRKPSTPARARCALMRSQHESRV